MAFGTFSMLTCISLLIFTWIPQLPLADGAIESSLRTASSNARILAKEFFNPDITDCSILLDNYAAKYLDSALEKYNDGESKDIIIEQIKEAQHYIKACQESAEAEFMLTQQLVDLQSLVNKTKEQVIDVYKFGSK